MRLRSLGAMTLLCAASWTVSPATVAHGQDAGGADDLVHLGTKQVSPRVQVVRLSTPALGGATEVRVLLPEGYDPTGGTRYPVLYILHGATGNSTRWLEVGGVEAATAGRPLIVVMPDGGQFGFYTDWWNFGVGGPPQWETYHLTQLIPWIDDNYSTVASRDGRAIAGESMGGLGAMHYAATRPDLFTAAASFSGAIDTNFLAAPPVVEVATMAEYKHLPAAAFGPRATEEVRYRGHNPVDLAENLRGLLLQLDVGDGLVGGPLGAGVDPVEMAMHEMGLQMHQRLDSHGIGHGWNAFPGCHCWPDWARDLRALVPRLMERFADPVRPPSPFTYTSIRPSYEIYGWRITIDRPALEFSRLSGAGPDGFALTGSGRARVTTAPLFGAGQIVSVTVSDPNGTATSTAVAGSDGRVTVPISLGPGNPFQQFSIPGNLWAVGVGTPSGTWPTATATVSFEPVVAPAAPASRDDEGTVSATPDGRPAPAGATLPATGRNDGQLTLVLAIATALLAGRPRARARHDPGSPRAGGPGPCL